MTRPMTPLRQRMLEDMRQRELAPNTQQTYMRAVTQLAEYFKASPDTLSVDQVRQFLWHLLQERSVSGSYYNQLRSGLEFFFCATMGRHDFLRGIPRAPSHTHDLTVPSPEEMARVLSSIQNKKHRTMFTAMYEAGLQISEVLMLRPEDIDRKGMVLKIRNRTGQYRRTAELSGELLNVFTDYYETYRPRGWMFPGQNAGEPLHKGAVRQAVVQINKHVVLTTPIFACTFRQCHWVHKRRAGANSKKVQLPQKTGEL